MFDFPGLVTLTKISRDGFRALFHQRKILSHQDGLKNKMLYKFYYQMGYKCVINLTILIKLTRIVTGGVKWKVYIFPDATIHSQSVKTAVFVQPSFLIYLNYQNKFIHGLFTNLID